MIETLHNANGKEETRVRRAFGWVVTFRDFPVGAYQTVDGNSMMAEALTYFTKGRAEFYLDGVRRGDRVPGILSSEHDIVGEGGTFTLKYIEPTTRVCIPLKAKANKNKIPTVTQLDLRKGETLLVRPGFKALICLGNIQVGDRIFKEESPIAIETGDLKLQAMSERVLLLDFTNCPRP